MFRNACSYYKQSRRLQSSKTDTNHAVGLANSSHPRFPTLSNKWVLSEPTHGHARCLSGSTFQLSFCSLNLLSCSPLALSCFFPAWNAVNPRPLNYGFFSLFKSQFQHSFFRQAICDPSLSSFFSPSPMHLTAHHCDRTYQNLK